MDAINATSMTTHSATCGQWRAQIAPGANEAAAMTDLTPHNRTITNGGLHLWLTLPDLRGWWAQQGGGQVIRQSHQRPIDRLRRYDRLRY